MGEKFVQNKFSRRGFTKALVTGALVVGFDSATGSWITSAHAASVSDFDKLPPLDGTLYLDEATRTEYAQDYGQVIHEQPLAVLKPGSLEDICRVVRFARRHKIRIAARGQGHLPFGQAQVSGGLVIDMRSLQQIHAVSGDRLEADAGIQWRALVKAAFDRGLMPPVLTGYLGLTVGGTLSIGGISPTTYRHGAQVDNTLELQVVTGEGEVVTCSDARNRDLFEAALAGQGQCAIITRAVVRLIPAPTKVREYVLLYPDLTTLIKDAAQLADDGRFDGASAFIVPSPGGGWLYFLLPTSNFTPPHTPDDAALLAGLGYLPGAKQVNDYGYLEYVDSIPNVTFSASRPDMTLCVPASAATTFTGALLSRLTPNDLGTASVIQLFFWPRAPFTRPLFRLPDEDIFGLAILRTQTTDPSVVDRMLAGNREMFEQNRSLGGTHYPFSAVQLSRDDWERHYGPHWDKLAQAKRRYDPKNVFASGPDIFLKHRTCDPPTKS
ncbi:MAG: FAD-binding protein [Acidobacteriota bacterium]|nr:FAD-binding protein [Acidobacteriota bacterium]